MFIVTLANGISVRNANTDEFISDILNLEDFDQCDLGYVFNENAPKISIPTYINKRYHIIKREDALFPFLHYASFRPIMIKAIAESEAPTETFHQNRRCTLHFLDVSSANITRDYLKLAWNAGAIGAYDIYLVSIPITQLGLLNFSEIFDFQRMFIAASSSKVLLIFLIRCCK